MKLIKFSKLIEAMPEHEHTCDSKRNTWHKFIDKNDRVGGILQSIFDNEADGKGVIRISRYDLYTEGEQADLSKFIVKTFIWGYPSGGRGNNFENISLAFDTLLSRLNLVRQHGIHDWNAHYKEIKTIKGLGLSTYTKFLQFLRVKINNKSAIILDARIGSVVNKNVFEEFGMIKNKDLEYMYPDYLDRIHKIADEYGFRAENIEFFLFEFGLILKEHPCSPKARKKA